MFTQKLLPTYFQSIIFVAYQNTDAFFPIKYETIITTGNEGLSRPGYPQTGAYFQYHKNGV